jgi:serine protease Do
MKNYLFFAITCLVSALLGAFFYSLIQPVRQVVIRDEPAPAFTTGGESQGGVSPALPTTFTSFSTAALLATPAVVNVKTIQQNDAFQLWGEGVQTSAGSGVILSDDGYIVTNGHVIEQADRIEVTLHDKREFQAELIGIDPSTDLALLKIKARKLPFLVFGNSDSLMVGEWVLAVGNPFNLESTVTAGIVSAKGRSIDVLDSQDRIESFIQTDAAVNPGNSGGALINAAGQLVGINTAIVTQSGRYEGYSFAVPANLASKVIRDLRDYGIVQRGLMGVAIENLDIRMAGDLGLKSAAGVRITRVSPGSGAEDAGLKKDDVIISINNIKTATMAAMQEQIGRLRPGNVASVDFYRKGKLQTTTIILKSKTNDTRPIAAAQESLFRNLGFELRRLSGSERRKMDAEGLKVISVYRNSTIKATNMEPGFVILKANGKAVSSPEALYRQITAAKGKIVLEGRYEAHADTYYYTFNHK